MDLSIENRTVTHSTFVIERSYPVKPERVFAAFNDPASKRRWYADPGNHEVEAFESDFRVGGREGTRYRMGPDTPIAGSILSNEAIYQDIVPNRRIVVASTMSLGDRHIVSALSTFELIPKGSGTELIFTEQGAFYEGSGGPEMRERGWRKLLDQLGAELTRGSSHA